MVKVVVHITFENGKRVKCAELTCPEVGDRQGATFQYAPSYLKDPQAFPLDPLKLPLESGPVPVRTPSGIPHAIQDSLPDSYGLGLLKQRARAAGLSPDEVPAHLLIALGNGAMGALDFQLAKGKRYAGPPSGGLPKAHIQSIVQAAQDYDQGLPVSDIQLKNLLDASSSPGGARPKALVQSNDDRLYLAKFARTGDKLDMVRLEAASLTVAKWAGLPVPDHGVESVGDHNIFMIERFDRAGENLLGRRHRISFDSLLRDREDMQPRSGYADIMNAIQRWSGQPHIDKEILFRQMCLNVLLGNTDDHLRNFSMIVQDGEWRLSPVYDVLPYHHERACHSILLPGNPPSTHPPEGGIEDLEQFGKNFRVPKAKAIVQEIAEAISRWPEACEKHGVPPIQTALTHRYIQSRINPAQPEQAEEDVAAPGPR